MTQINPNDEIYPIGVVSRLTGLPQRFLRALEQRGVLTPARSATNRRLYSEIEVNKLRQIYYLAVLRKVNIPGIKVFFEVLDRLPSSEALKILEMFEGEAVEISEAREAADEPVPSSIEEQKPLLEELDLPADEPIELPPKESEGETSVETSS